MSNGLFEWLPKIDVMPEENPPATLEDVIAELKKLRKKIKKLKKAIRSRER